MFKHDQSEACVATIRKADTEALAASWSPSQRELTDRELASVIGGLPLPIHKPPKTPNPK